MLVGARRSSWRVSSQWQADHWGKCIIGHGTLNYAESTELNVDDDYVDTA